MTLSGKAWITYPFCYSCFRMDFWELPWVLMPGALPNRTLDGQGVSLDAVSGLDAAAFSTVISKLSPKLCSQEGQP